ncbi:MAG: hypothetical protein JNM54_00400 [Candidatus Accumulibacter sp.]|uniref:hypothetical protein n=1 Tax=unclassified Candidatus Accumulibacter TaxID=2619054 RepID=UPI001A47522C|nr:MULTISPECIES: hypothetical protein [unclassified Candidatus Accumulibacter]MBL8366368.1 hypothetical protein [Accumulibacter sp.]
MSMIGRRVVRLEKACPSGLEALSDQELQARIDEMCTRPDVQAWIAQGEDDDPERVPVLRLLSL